MSGDGPLDDSLPRDLGRMIVEARRSLLGMGLMKPELASRGAVWGVLGVKGEAGICCPLLLMLLRESFFLLEGVMAMRARESFIEMERRRRCDDDCLTWGMLALGEFS
jgi:hypothetical protein